MVGIAEAAHRLGISQDTVRRRLNNGELPGQRQKHAGGFKWNVELPEEDDQAPTDNPGLGQDQAQLVTILMAQIEAKDTQISELHRLLAQAQQPALPEPSKGWLAKLLGR